MEKEEAQTQPSTNIAAYIVGIVVLALVVGAAYIFRPKTTTMIPTETTPAVVAETPVPGPITGLGCDAQYYNPVVGFNQYYLSVDGGDISTAKQVTCTFSVMLDDKVIATATAESPLTAQPARGGSTFRCTTQALDLTPNVPMDVEVTITDDLDSEVVCTDTFVFPPQI